MEAWIYRGGDKRQRRRIRTDSAYQTTVVTRCWRPKAMSLSGPVRRRAMPWTQRHGRNGYWWCAPPGMQPNRPRGWKNVCARRRQNLAALTPPRGRGKRQITDEDRPSWRPWPSCSRSIGWRGCSAWPGKSRSSRPPTTWGGGRGSLSREKRVMQKTRYHIAHIARQEDTIAAPPPTFWLESFCHQCGAKAAVFAGCGVGLS